MVESREVVQSAPAAAIQFFAIVREIRQGCTDWLSRSEALEQSCVPVAAAGAAFMAQLQVEHSIR